VIGWEGISISSLLYKLSKEVSVDWRTLSCAVLLTIATPSLLCAAGPAQGTVDEPIQTGKLRKSQRAQQIYQQRITTAERKEAATRFAAARSAARKRGGLTTESAAPAKIKGGPDK
jgi:hypothetical protein